MLQNTMVVLVGFGCGILLRMSRSAEGKNYIARLTAIVGLPVCGYCVTALHMQMRLCPIFDSWEVGHQSMPAPCCSVLLITT